MDSSDPTPHLERFESYQQACRELHLSIPQRFNIANAVCRRHADAVTRIALNEVKYAGTNTYTFGALDFLSDKFAMVLSKLEIKHGDSVALLLPQSAALAVAQLGVLKTGAAVVPLSMSSDSGSLEHALIDSSARAFIVDESICGAANAVAQKVPSLESRFVVRDLRPTVSSYDFKDFWTEVDRASSDFEPVETDARSRAFIFYVDLRGKPTGVVHSHLSVIGQLSAFEMFNNLERYADSVFWTADDWSSSRALLGVLYPAWWYGCALVAGTSEDLASPLHLIERAEVTHAFFTRSQLRTFAESEPQPGKRLELKLRRVLSDGPLSPESLDWAKEKLSVTLNEVYGKPETGWIAGRCDCWFPIQVGSVGRAVPGHSIDIIDDSGRVLPALKPGRIAVHKPDPSLFSELHQAPDQTAASFLGDWFLTGDIGYKSQDGDLFIHHPRT